MSEIVERNNSKEDKENLSNETIKLLDEKVISSHGPHRHVRRWYKGWVKIPDVSDVKYIDGHTGPETVVELDIIKPTKTFDVIEDE